ncbi:MAG: hypothetical protein M1368_02325, partial [Thaumarchaeota archaeon]|nr:hypothetical protein [Nitrososphaerota archaeon]
MNFRKVWVIMQSLLLSQLRATARRTASIRSLIRRPIVLVVLDVALFGVAAAAAYFVGSAIAGSSASELFSTFVSSALVILPAILLSIILLLGLVFEITSSYQFSSSDTVNWLPVASGEYVLASILSVVVYYSAVPAILIGGTMSLALTFGMFPAWEASTLLSISSVFLAAGVLELIRALLNRFSTSFYKKGGQAAVALRAVFGVAVIVVLQLLFYPSLYTHFVGAISASFGPAWFIPILWASVGVSALLNGSQSLGLSFAGMSVALTLVMI